jgi:acetyl esterase
VPAGQVDVTAPVRSGYFGDGHQLDPALVPPGGAQAVPR